jgi:uncharacterized protein (DUF924 family)
MFLLMPMMHSEDRADHATMKAVFTEQNVDNVITYLDKHSVIIDQFGRYPHRNALLGRISTSEEVEWMKTNSGF